MPNENPPKLENLNNVTTGDVYYSDESLIIVDVDKAAQLINSKNKSSIPDSHFGIIYLIYDQKSLKIFLLEDVFLNEEKIQNFADKIAIKFLDPNGKWVKITITAYPPKKNNKTIEVSRKTDNSVNYKVV